MGACQNQRRLRSWALSLEVVTGQRSVWILGLFGAGLWGTLNSIIIIYSTNNNNNNNNIITIIIITLIIIIDMTLHA